MNIEFVTNSPKNIKEMKAVINAASVKDKTLAERLEALTGFPIKWQALNVVQAALVWLAWCSINGNNDAALAIILLRETPEEGNDGEDGAGK